MLPLIVEKSKERKRKGCDNKNFPFWQKVSCPHSSLNDPRVSSLPDFRSWVCTIMHD